MTNTFSSMDKFVYIIDDDPVYLKFMKEHFKFDLIVEKQISLFHLCEEGLVINQNHHLFLTKKGKLLADGIAQSLFIS